MVWKRYAKRLAETVLSVGKSPLLGRPFVLLVAVLMMVQGVMGGIEDHNFGELLQKSLYFYDVQRSGDLPADYRVYWRGDSALEDGAEEGLNLGGGFYDAGDHVKFGFPLAYTLTVLSWGAIEYWDAYVTTGQSVFLKQILRWGADYLMRCNLLDADGRTISFAGQVGDPELDHAWWGAPEGMSMPRPVYFIDSANPGSDLAAEAAAALAAVSMVLGPDDEAYEEKLLTHSVALYTFADAYRGRYSDSILKARDYYPSSGYQDELVWSAAWLYRATEDLRWLEKARAEYALLPDWGGFKPWNWTLSWDDKTYGCFVLMALLDSNPNYRAAAERWLDYWTQGVDGQRVTYTPGGLAWLSEWGSLRYTANTAFCALVYADRVSDPGGRYAAFAFSQVDYILGNNPHHRSFVCGYGVNPPIAPHHRASHGSTRNDIDVPVYNQYTLYGALVGGVGHDDAYSDERRNYRSNEVALDYNSAFTGVLAGLQARFGGEALVDFGRDGFLLYQPMDYFPVGYVTDSDWKVLWPGTKWANGPDEGRVAVDSDLGYLAKGNSVRIEYPEGGQQPANSGAQWFMDLNGSYEDVYMSYWVRFSPDFDFVLGGKLPGLGGAHSFDDRTHEWSARLMWRENGRLEFYVHVPSENAFDPGTRFWWNTEGEQAILVPGRWHHIELRAKLNNPGQFNGLLEGWLDGELMGRYDTFYFRDEATASASIAWAFFSTFFGGSSSPVWQATKNETAHFDHIIVSRERIGYPGKPSDVDGDGISNEWELLHFGTDWSADPVSDADEDGQINYDEYLTGSLPHDPSSRFSPKLRREGTSWEVEVDGVVGRRYRLFRSLDLTSESWELVSEKGPLKENQTFTFSDLDFPGRAFYRVVVMLSE